MPERDYLIFHVSWLTVLMAEMCADPRVPISDIWLLHLEWMEVDKLLGLETR
jgi:hypothetical protein